MNLPANPSEAFKRRNPTLYPVVGLASIQREQDTHPALVKDASRKPTRKGRLAVVVTIIACRRRLFDDDNSAMGGTKALRDAIAETLAIDDGSSRIRFQYGQQHTTGATGTIVVIERL